MNIPLKTLLIFCLVVATAAQSATDEPSTSTADGSTVTTAPVETGTFATDDTSASTTIMTQASEETTTGTFKTDATTNSTDNTTISRTSATPTTTTQDPCASSRCVGDSTCEARFGGSFVCICRSGLVYSETGGCIQTGKVFPGNLTLVRTFDAKMADRTTKEFFDTASEIEQVLRKILGDDSSYINSTVLGLRSGSIIADVQNLYDLSSSATSQTVEETIVKAINDGNFTDAGHFTGGSVCDTDICDKTTTNCLEPGVSGAVSCICIKGYIRSQFTSFSCRPCPNGEMAVGEHSCKKCPFGFAGFNCNDPYLLVVVVVSTVLGALLIIFIVALIVVNCRNEKEISSQVDFSSSYGNKELHKPTGVPRIPRANPDASWKSNTLEMTNSGSNQALVTRDRPESKARYNDYDDVMSYRGQIPPTYGGRGVENGGAHNPYFRQDDDRTHRY